MTIQKDFTKAQSLEFQVAIARDINISGIDAYSNTPDHELAHEIGIFIDMMAKVKQNKKNERDIVISKLNDRLNVKDAQIKELHEGMKTRKRMIDAANCTIRDLEEQDSSWQIECGHLEEKNTILRREFEEVLELNNDLEDIIEEGFESPAELPMYQLLVNKDGQLRSLSNGVISTSNSVKEIDELIERVGAFISKDSKMYVVVCRDGKIKTHPVDELTEE